MSFARVAIMTFKDDFSKTHSLTIKDVKEDVEESDISDLMDFMIATDVMKTSARTTLVKKVSAKIQEVSSNNFEFDE